MFFNETNLNLFNEIDMSLNCSLYYSIGMCSVFLNVKINIKSMGIFFFDNVIKSGQVIKSFNLTFYLTQVLNSIAMELT